mmetsp:Transcript_14470/g.29583  ORF Transcript_14470/g.29583 Transcript_14470/m.29583 type:complete len:137 (-) Transcript_14470:1139-1549(-)
MDADDEQCWVHSIDFLEWIPMVKYYCEEVYKEKSHSIFLSTLARSFWVGKGSRGISLGVSFGGYLSEKFSLRKSQNRKATEFLRTVSIHFSHCKPWDRVGVGKEGSETGKRVRGWNGPMFGARGRLTEIGDQDSVR